MLIYIIFNEDYESNAKSLRDAVKAEWSDSSINMMGTPRTLYQVQIDNEIVFSDDSVTDNNTIINLIKEEL
jgi:hypothetical protein|tara:strand:- start:207 stop:419 length:213 start_codon:yes stop_codon:yes gene_type:complete